MGGAHPEVIKPRRRVGRGSVAGGRCGLTALEWHAEGAATSSVVPVLVVVSSTVVLAVVAADDGAKTQ
jgi:hypothetical protein